MNPCRPDMIRIVVLSLIMRYRLEYSATLLFRIANKLRAPELAKKETIYQYQPYIIKAVITKKAPNAPIKLDMINGLSFIIIP